ncbi:MAG: hypothetical protein FJZ57_05175 [Chlamydiae bacterium]|nr:hypothetical protein [Chlamydiota bacterium]
MTFHYENYSSSGYLQYHYSDNTATMHLDRIVSHTKGFGTDGYRHMMKAVFERNIPSITTDASFSSHVFHTFMGMIPLHNHGLSSVKLQFGNCGLKALTAALQLNDCESLEELDKFLAKNGKLLKIILLYYQGEDSDYDEVQPLTLEEFKQNKEAFEEIQTKTEPYIQTIFLPNIMHNRIPQESGMRRSTEVLTSVMMKMSPEGMARWRESIEENKPFVPFKDLSHLRIYMDNDQLNSL